MDIRECITQAGLTILDPTAEVVEPSSSTVLWGAVTKDLVDQDRLDQDTVALQDLVVPVDLQDPVVAVAEAHLDLVVAASAAHLDQVVMVAVALVDPDHLVDHREHQALDLRLRVDSTTSQTSSHFPNYGMMPTFPSGTRT